MEWKAQRLNREKGEQSGMELIGGFGYYQVQLTVFPRWKWCYINYHNVKRFGLTNELTSIIRSPLHAVDDLTLLYFTLR